VGDEDGGQGSTRKREGDEISGDTKPQSVMGGLVSEDGDQFVRATAGGGSAFRMQVEVRAVIEVIGKEPKLKRTKAKS
jgi:hypothetical protein